MSLPFNPRGVWTALATPFTSTGAVDLAAFRRLVRFQVEQGTTGIVPCGTTGESPTLTWHEHDDLVSAAIDEAGGRIGVLAGTGSNSTDEAIRGTRDARERGASAALLVDCYYNGPSSLELRTEYYERVLAAVPDLPIVPYVIPGRTGCALSAEDLAILHRSDPARVPAVKEATGDLDRMRRDRALAGETLAIFSGDDDVTLAMMRDPAIGACGVISVMSNLVPGALARMVDAQANGDAARAADLATKLAPLLKIVGVAARSTRHVGGQAIEVEDKFRNPLPLKTVMIGLGMIGGGCRPPLGRMTSPAVEICRDAVRAVHRAAPELLRPIEEAFAISIEARLANDAHWAL